MKRLVLPLFLASISCSIMAMENVSIYHNPEKKTITATVEESGAITEVTKNLVTRAFSSWARKESSFRPNSTGTYFIPYPGPFVKEDPITVAQLKSEIWKFEQNMNNNSEN